MQSLLTLSGPFTIADAAALGVSRQQVRTLTNRGSVVRLERGWYIVRQGIQDDDAARLRVAMAQAPRGAVLTGAAAAEHHGLLLPDRAARDRVSFILPADGAPRTRQTDLLSIASRPLPREHVVRVRGIDVTSPAWTALELSLGQPLPQALIPLDSALRQGVTRAELQAVAREFRSRKGMSGLASAIGEADGLAESALESRSRGHFLDHGLPRPQLQVVVRLDHGRTARVDLAWREFGLVGEVDGLLKYGADCDYRAEKIREMQLRRLGIHVERWTKWDLDYDLPRLIARLQQYMQR